MFDTALTETEMFRISESRNAGRARMSTERKRAALQMQRERRRRQSQASAAQPGHVPSEMTPGVTPSW